MLRIAVTWLLLQILQSSGPDLALDFRVDEIHLDVFRVSLLAAISCWIKIQPIVQKFSRVLGGKAVKKKA
jgi:hypothetical protein